MFKLVQWAFKLGQQTERQRIANILESHRRTTMFMEGIGTNEPDERRERIEAIEHNVGRIIDDITNPTQWEESRYSLLYPKEDK